MLLFGHTILQQHRASGGLVPANGVCGAYWFWAIHVPGQSAAKGSDPNPGTSRLRTFILERWAAAGGKFTQGCSPNSFPMPRWALQLRKSATSSLPPPKQQQLQRLQTQQLPGSLPRQQVGARLASRRKLGRNHELHFSSQKWRHWSCHLHDGAFRTNISISVLARKAICGALRGASVSYASMKVAEMSTSGWTERNNGLDVCWSTSQQLLTRDLQRDAKAVYFNQLASLCHVSSLKGMARLSTGWWKTNGSNQNSVFLVKFRIPWICHWDCSLKGGPYQLFITPIGSRVLTPLYRD